MDGDARLWVRRFVDGVNHYQDSAAELPHDFAILGLEPEPWTVADVLAIGRLGGTDVNWLVWADLLALRARDDWPELWARLVKEGGASFASFGGPGHMAAMQEWLAGVSRSGSNSVAVAGRRSATGGALMANDPHLGIFIPNVWLIAGVRSPSCHAVGLMAPGLPIFAIGRNRHIAWGGTNMRAASSDLYNVGGHTGVRSHGAARADRRALVVRRGSDRPRDPLGADRDRHAAPREVRPAAARAEMDRARRERRDRRHAQGLPGEELPGVPRPPSTASPCRGRTCSMRTGRGISAR